uniref:Uncharacterized protein n=1 Tax=Cacopsylla melanoneura TaxID=428564 RepID=A0A8D8YI08_9HEMI
MLCSRSHPLQPPHHPSPPRSRLESFHLLLSLQSSHNLQQFQSENFDLHNSLFSRREEALRASLSHHSKHCAVFVRRCEGTHILVRCTHYESDRHSEENSVSFYTTVER